MDRRTAHAHAHERGSESAATIGGREGGAGTPQMLQKFLVSDGEYTAHHSEAGGGYCQ